MMTLRRTRRMPSVIVFSASFDFVSFGVSSGRCRMAGVGPRV